MAMDKVTQETANRIRAIRQEKGLTQAQVAEKSKMDTNYYAKIERGNVSPALKAYEKIAKGLKVASSDIFPF
jgi:transcriptional regulator with XRE-family HTH domain